MRKHHWMLVSCFIPVVAVVAVTFADETEFFSGGTTSVRNGSENNADRSPVKFFSPGRSDSESTPSVSTRRPNVFVTPPSTRRGQESPATRFRREMLTAPALKGQRAAAASDRTAGQPAADRSGNSARPSSSSDQFRFDAAAPSQAHKGNQAERATPIIQTQFEFGEPDNPPRRIQPARGENPFEFASESQASPPEQPPRFDFSNVERPNPFADEEDIPNPFEDMNEADEAATYEDPDAGFGLPEPSSIDQIDITPNEGEGPLAYPSATEDSAGPQTPMVTVEWERSESINVGQKTQCSLIVRNSGRMTVGAVVVEAYLPQSVRLVSSDPQPESAAGTLAWQVGELDAGDVRKINLEIIPQDRGDMQAIAFVRFSGRATASFSVEEPMLEIAGQGPSKVMVGDSASHVITVSNPGTGIARNVSIQALIPEGLEHRRGRRLIMDIGPLNPGESRDVRLALTAVRGGRQVLQVRAVAEGDLVQESQSHVAVVAPQLKLGVEGPAVRYVGRNADYRIKVTNDGAADSNNVRVKYRIPEGFLFVNAGGGGKMNSTDNTVDWFLGRLESGQSAHLKVTLAAQDTGEFSHQVGAVSEHGATTTASLNTRVEGVASLAMEIRDLDDPVEIGAVTTYEVRVRNEGSKAASGVGLSCELPSGMKFVEARGPAQFIAENGLVVFKSLETLEPGRTAVYEVSVRGTRSGSHRFRTRLASDSIEEPLISEEMTQFYGE